VQARTGREPFGATPAGPAELLVLDAGRLRLAVSTLGAVVQSLTVADGAGAPRELVLGYANAPGYLADRCFVGAVAGRYANRIAHGRFVLDGRAHQVPTGPEPHALHGGPSGFHRKLWRVQDLGDDGSGRPRVELAYTSPAGEMGFPGALEATAAYSLDGDSVLVELAATTDAPTVVNLTQHGYFNLGGGLTERQRPTDVRDHVVSVAAGHYVAVDAEGIPDGTLAPVAGAGLDLREPGPLRRARDGVVDHCFVLDRPGLDTVAARVEADGVVLEVSTDAPGVQVYSGQHLRDTPVGRHGSAYLPHQGLCLETQWFPDSPNQPSFPATVLRPGEQWRSTTRWRVETV
jgi:aldose 1-epimerase